MKRNIRLAVLSCVWILLAGCSAGDNASNALDAITEPPVVSGDPLGAIGTKEQEQDRLFESLSANVIFPGYDQLSIESGDLEDTIKAFCADPTMGDFSILETAWADAMQAWQAISVVRFGPIEEDDLRLLVQFFPGDADAVVDVVTQLLDGADELTETLIANGPASAQGLSALEHILFELQEGLNDPVAGERRCELLTAIAENLTTITTDLNAAWEEGGSWRTDFDNASGAFASRTDVLTEILQSILLEVEMVINDKITSPLNGGETFAESFRSGLSGDNIIANLTALQTFFEIDGQDTSYGLLDYLTRAHEENVLVQELVAELDKAYNEISQLPNNFDDVIAGQAVGDLDNLRSALGELVALIIVTAIAIGVDLG